MIITYKVPEYLAKLKPVQVLQYIIYFAIFAAGK